MVKRAAYMGNRVILGTEEPRSSESKDQNLLRCICPLLTQSGHQSGTEL
jgi:hypothetical protein